MPESRLPAALLCACGVFLTHSRWLEVYHAAVHYLRRHLMEG